MRLKITLNTLLLFFTLPFRYFDRFHFKDDNYVNMY